VIARIEGKRPGPTVHFNSHIDVVEAGDGWSMDPFAGVIRDGRVYGRGACDMKGGLAASIIAVEAYLEANPDFPAPSKFRAPQMRNQAASAASRISPASAISQSRASIT
jgi:acetylornithine deacetylase/succinyl-diaminopimelate desuccinylase-like protein